MGSFCNFRVVVGRDGVVWGALAGFGARGGRLASFRSFEVRLLRGVGFCCAVLRGDWLLCFGSFPWACSPRAKLVGARMSGLHQWGWGCAPEARFAQRAGRNCGFCWVFRARIFGFFRRTPLRAVG